MFEQPDDPSIDCDVAVVGAGPVGLTMAARLASFGIHSIVLEREPCLVEQGSKACLIQGDALEVLAKVGCAREIEDEGVTWNVGHTYVKGREIATTVYPKPIGPGPFVNISQLRVEQILLRHIESTTECDLRWSHQVLEVEQRPDLVVLKVIDDQGRPRSIRVRYVIACDGVRSQLRHMIGATWAGYRHADQFLITDVRARLPHSKERHFHYDPPFNRGRQVVMHPQPDDVWRIDIQLPPDTLIDGSHTPGAPVPLEVHRRLLPVLGDAPYEVEWWSTYGFHQRVVDRFGVGRTFLAGDAAHAFPPYGARGMNSGIQDADNLAWKLGQVLSGHAREGLLDTYHEERHAAAIENLGVTEATIRFMVPPNRRLRLRRNVLLGLATLPNRHVATWARTKIDSGKMAQPFTYTSSGAIDRSIDHPLLGALAPDGVVETSSGESRLRQLLGNGFVLLYIGAIGAAVEKLIETTTQLTNGHVEGVIVGDGQIACQEARVVRAGPDLSTTYELASDNALLIRPDGYVGAVVPVAARPDELLRLLESMHCCAAAPTSTHAHYAARPQQGGR